VAPEVAHGDPGQAGQDTTMEGMWTFTGSMGLGVEYLRNLWGIIYGQLYGKLYYYKLK